MTKTELIHFIGIRIKQAKPFLREYFLNGLKYRSKSELEQILEKVKVSSDGYDISTI